MTNPPTAGRRTMRAIPAFAALLVLAGCGTYHQRADSTALNGEATPAAWTGSITIASSPAGAACTVTRDGAQVAQITAPAPVTLARGNTPAEVRCTAPGHLATTTALRPLRDFAVKLNQATGPVGAQLHAEDVRTGRVRRFFDVTVTLPPATFATAAERDTWFAARAEAIRAAWAVQIGRAERSQDAMIDSAATLRGYMDADLATLEQQKAATTIARPARRR
ncbi:hypothetical protein GXW78_07925 [Roseomonas terrae]|uniref:Lipoprotein n=1 Tax=Neoroseomonas terrae TaxID=424799 RepID=A0ABS5EEZ9_9PROT|nr:hypothetical protein [Neoroseomonas terrae]MBR0649584.1 hypothetical protein [Neoroseomonas terrae]